jgi:predicted dehydrogenase
MLSGALLGAGNIARNGHLPAYRTAEVARRLRIVAAADPCPENLTALRQLLPEIRVYADPTELLRRERLGFVDICAPPFAHHALIEQAVENGCHVLCEKPLTTRYDEALAIRRLLDGSGLVAVPCHQYHYAPQWQCIRGILASGAIGEVQTGVLTVHRVGANPGAAAWRPAWRTERCLAGGGILVDHGAHLFYQLHSVFGPPREIACVTEQRLGAYEVDDTATVVLGYERAIVRVMLTWAARERYSSHWYRGNCGELRCFDDRLELETCTGRRTISFAEGLSTGSAHADWFEPLLLDFAARVDAGDTSPDRLEEALDVARYFTLAYASAAEGGRPQSWGAAAPDSAPVGLLAAD